MLGSGDFEEAAPENGPLTLPLDRVPTWIRMRLYGHVDDHEPGVGDRGEHHLIHLWAAPEAPPVHPELTEADRTPRRSYKNDFDQSVAAWRR
ncbi:hypothetical protein CQW39_31140 [Streptomyces griseofuscus]|uniref:hypothetical protein n=1 Tax=Streptomyces griseofuscus TaxID=146922 RepID=UPI000F64D6A0|nr:hypothetical protein [Streptomyces griseofuscus]RRQ72594.1 hypothetical protein CQW39_31140 [Streptomyces griseofuscus]